MTQAYLGYLRDAVLKLKKFAPRATGKNPAILISSPSGYGRRQNIKSIKSFFSSECNVLIGAIDKTRAEL